MALAPEKANARVAKERMFSIMACLFLR